MKKTTSTLAGLIFYLSSSFSIAETLKGTSTGNITTLLNPFCCLIQGILNPHAMIHDTLFSVSTDGSLKSGLATSAEPKNKTKWIIKLRPNVMFSNGRIFDASAVVKTIKYLQSPQARRFVISAETRTIKEIRAIDELTLEVETFGPDVLLDRRFGTIPIPEPWLYEELGPEKFIMSPVGTGSYKLKEWNLKSQRPVLISNETSWRKPVEIKKVELRVVKDAASQVQALMSGIVDIGSNFGVTELDYLKENGFNILISPGGQIAAIVLSNLDPNSPFSDIRVRQAINYAVDKESIAKIIMGGTTKPAGQPGIMGMTGYNPMVSPYEFNPKKSRELLLEAGYQKGFQFRAEVLISGGIAEATSMYQKIAQDLLNIGIKMEIQPLQGSEWIRKYFTGDWGKADAISATWNSASYWDVIRAVEIFSCKKPAPFFCKPNLMNSINATHNMFDKEERIRALRTLSKTMHELAPSLFLVQVVDIIAADKKFDNIVFRHKQLAVDQLRIVK